MPLTIVRNDITRMSTDAIVNAANNELQMGGGVCGAIFRAAGAGKLQAACDILAPIHTGDAIITQGFDLPAKYIIHTAGPRYQDGRHNEEKLLRACYINSLTLARENGCKSISFPLISSGIYGYPKEESLRVATSAIRDFLDGDEMDVSLVVFDKTAFSLSKELLGEVREFIDEHYARGHDDFMRRHEQALNVEIELFYNEEIADSKALMHAPSPTGLDDLVGKLDESFSAALLRLIDARGKSDTEVYKRANIDRRHFSKIRSNKNYMPSKKTVIAFAVALELDLDETRDLLERAGFALSHSVMFDVIVEYFITSGRYDIYEINNVLFEYDQLLLGG